MKNSISVKRICSWLLIACLLMNAFPLIPQVVSATDTAVTEHVVYVGGENAADTNDGLSAETSVATMKAAYEKIPTDNVVTRIVVCGEVMLAESGFENHVNSTNTSTSADRYILPAHSGEVIITSTVGETMYSGGSLNFGGKSYCLQGNTTFENIQISSSAVEIYAYFYQLNYGDGITAASGVSYYPAKKVFLGLKNPHKVIHTVQDVAFTMNSGKIEYLYGGNDYFTEDDCANYSVSIAINGGSVDVLYGCSLTTTAGTAKHKGIAIAANGGTIKNIYATNACGAIGEGGITVSVKAGAIVKTRILAEKTSDSTAATVSGPITLDLTAVGTAWTAPATAVTGFTNVKLADSQVSLPGTALAEGAVVSLTDAGKLTLTGTAPTGAYQVAVTQSGDSWNTENTLLEAPAGTGNVFTLAEPAGYELQYTAGTDANATWKLAVKESSGEDTETTDPTDPSDPTGPSDPEVRENVWYVDGEKGADTNDGTTATTALKTMAAAYAKVPSDNEETTIVICGPVNLADSGLAWHNTPQTRILVPAHTGKVVITSKIGDEDYTATAALNFGTVTLEGDNFGAKMGYCLQGNTKFENIAISSPAAKIHAYYYRLELGEGITGSGTYYPAEQIFLGFKNETGTYQTQDVVFTMKSGVVNNLYGGNDYYNNKALANYSVSITIEGGSVTTLYGSSLASSGSGDSMHNGIEITVSGGKVTNLYGAHGSGAIGSGGITVVLKENASVTKLYAAADKATVAGTKKLVLNGVEAAPTKATGFTELSLVGSNVTLTADHETMWSTITRLSMTDDSTLAFETAPTAAIEVVAEKAGTDWNTATALITAPAGTAANMFTLVSPIRYELKHTDDSANASWTLQKAENLQLGQWTGSEGSALDIDLKLPDGSSFTPLGENATAYETFQAKLADLTAAGSGTQVPVVSPVAIKGEIALYVSPNGSDENNGSIDAPFKTIQKALSWVEMLQMDDEPFKGIIVYLRAGTYVANETITIGAVHSGIDKIPVIISAYDNEEVVITGGTDIEGSKFKPVKDVSEEAYAKLPAAIRDQVVAVDLAALGISTEGAQITSSGPNYQVFVGGEELTLSRYPNATKLALTGKVLHIGEITATYSSLGPKGTNSDDPDIRFEMTDLRPTLWENDGNIWLNGSLYAEWDIQNIRVKEAAADTGVMRMDGGSTLGAVSKPTNTYYYYNILEELDVPGEFYLNSTNGILYLYPIGDMSTATVTYSAMQSDLIQLSQAENVVLNGLTVENGAGYGIYMTNCTQAIVQNCTLRNLGYGIRIHGQKSGMIYSDVYQIANAPVRISESQTYFDYTPEQNFLQNCYIYDVGTRNPKICQVRVYGTGNVVSHNLMQGMYGVAIYLQHAKECIVEYNEIVGAPSGTYDYGAIYHPYNPADTGNHIRYNYIHDIGIFSEEGNPYGIYFDEGLRGNYAYGNIMYNVPCGFFTNSGSENVIINNIVMNGRQGTTAALSSANNFAAYTIDAFMSRNTILKTVYEKYMALSDAEKAALKERYPLQAALYNTIAATDSSAGVGLSESRANYVHDNLLVNHGEISFKGADHDIANNIVKDTDPFTNAKNHDFSLTDASAISWPVPSMNDIGVTGTKQTLKDFSKYSPSNGDQKADPFQVLLKWSSAGGADTYEVKISKNADMSEPQAHIVQGRSFSFDIGAYDETYYWTVTAYTTAESRSVTSLAADNGAVSSFKTMTKAEYVANNPVDTSKLQAAITEAEAFAQDVVDTANGGLYADGTAAQLANAITDAKAVLEDTEGQDQISVNQATATLENAVLTAKLNRIVRYVTFAEFDTLDWSDPAKQAVTTTLSDGVLTMSVPSSRSENVYAPGVGIRDILCFKYKLDTKTTWNGFAIAQTNTNTFITSGTDGYFICINPAQVELQKYQGGSKQVQIDVAIDDSIFNGGEYYNVEIGAINNPDGSVGIHFKINDTLIFDPAVHLDTAEDAVLPGDPITNCENFGVVVNVQNGNAYLQRSVAEVSGIRYATLTEAIEAAQINDTVTLLGDAEAVTVSKALIINKNGFSATINAGDGFTLRQGSGSLIIIDAAEPTITVNEVSLELEGEVYMNLYTSFSGFKETVDAEDVGLLIWTGSEAPNEESFRINGENTVAYSNVIYADKQYKVRSEGIPAKELGEEHHMRVYAKLNDESYVYSEIVEPFGPETYALYWKDSDNTALKQTTVAMLDYAAAAQTYFGYRINDLANAGDPEYMDQNRVAYTEDMMIAVKTADEVLVGTLTRDRDNCPTVLPSLILEGAITCNFRVRFSDSLMSENATATFKFWDAATYAKMQAENTGFADTAPTKTVTATVNEDGYYMGGYDNIAAKELSDTLYMCVEITVDGKTYNSGIISYSPHAYVEDRLANSSNNDLKVLLKQLVVYGDQAKSYFTNP